MFLSIDKWETTRNKSIEWLWLDKCDSVFDSINCNKGPCGQCMHDSCRLVLMDEKELNLAIKIIYKKEPIFRDIHGPKRLRSRVSVIHENNLYVWSREGDSNSITRKFAY